MYFKGISFAFHYAKTYHGFLLRLLKIATWQKEDRKKSMDYMTTQ